MGRKFSPVCSVFASLHSGISCRRSQVTPGEALGFGARVRGARLGEKLPQGGDVQQKLWQAEKLFSWINGERRVC